MNKIYIISMPFMPVQWPPLGVGQLVAAAQNAGMEAKALYAYLSFAKILGLPMYNFISAILRPYSQPHSLLAEWFFSGFAFEGFDFPYDEYLSRNFRDNSRFMQMAHTIGFRKDEAFFINEFKNIQERATQFVEEHAQQIIDDHAVIVGCSTSFMQYSASLALLRAVKRLNPSIITMLGGANCEAEMGYVTAKNFDWVDFVVSGEADTIFPDLCQKIFKNGSILPLEDIPYGVYCKTKLLANAESSDTESQNRTETAYIENMDEIPMPDYQDYFAALQQLDPGQQIGRVLVMETSRGCWKGDKQPCNFCGLNGKRKMYRAKSSQRVLQELDTLSQTYGMTNFIMTDTILNMKYFKDLFLSLAQNGKPYKLFFETRSNLKQQQVAMLADAGVVWIQAGIESFHDELLKLLNKGTVAIHNIALLKYALENGIKCTWYILHDIPGDRDRYYQEMADFLPLLYHLEPPFFVRPIRFDRFSEYYLKSEQFGLRLSPLSNYNYVYPFDQDDLKDFATFFRNDRETLDESPEKPGLALLKSRIAEWRVHFYKLKKNPRAELVMTETDSQTIIFDSRPCAVSSECVLTDIKSFIYRCCRKPMTKKQLYHFLDSHNTRTADALEPSLQALIERKLLLHLNNQYLALANYKPTREVPNVPTGF